MWKRLRRRLRYLLNSSERARLLREEMEAHIENKIQEFMENGMTKSDARAAARRQFGNLTINQEDARATWIARWLGDFVKDVAFAARTIRKQPGFAAVATLSAALGIGACSMIFGIANYALFRPLPVNEPSRLMSVSGKNLRRGKVGMSVTYPDFNDLRQARSFDALTAFFSFMPATIAANGEPARFWGSLVTANYFDVVRPPFLLGRGFDPARDDTSGATPVVVLSHNLWRSRFGSDRGIVGKPVQLNGRNVTVVGVTGPGFRGTELMFYSEFWLPFSMLSALDQPGISASRLQDRNSQWLTIAGRLRHDVTEQQAAAEIETIGTRLAAAYPASNKDRSFYLERAGQVHPGFRKMTLVFFLMLLGVSALVLCTACANIANLLLARAAARQQEIATRLAIGAGRGRLVRQLLTESVMLALLGGIGGYLIAQIGAAGIGRSSVPIGMPVDLSVSLDYRVMVFCVALSAITGVVFGLVPALRATHPNLTGALKNERTQLGPSRIFGLRNLLVVAQVAICMVLLICSGLFLRSLQSARQIDTGFTHRNLLMLAFDPSLNRYSPAETRRLVTAILDNARALPGVESATLANSVPLNIEGTQDGFSPEGKLPGTENGKFSADIYAVSTGYFETFGIPIINGVDFRPGVPAEDIVIVNKALADAVFGNTNPVGHRLHYLGRTVRITGVVGTTKSRTIGEDPHLCLYFPLERDIRGNHSLTGMTLVLRTRNNPAAFTQNARQMIRTIDPALAVFNIRTMETQIAQALFLPKAAAFLFGLAGFMGVLISTIGIYGVVSFSVARQTKEIGIRMALGARQAQVLSMVLRHGVVLTIAGSAIGFAIALALSRTAASLLYGISPTDPATFILVPLLLLAVAIVACLIPARRAAALDPLRALRYE